MKRTFKGGISATATMVALVAVLLAASLLVMGCSKNSGGKSFYVRETSSDSNSGTSESKAFKTLGQALQAVKASEKIKTITVIGMLSANTEGYESDASFRVTNSGAVEILITGKLEAADEEKAVLSGIVFEEDTINVSGASKLRFENIEISGSRKVGMRITDGASVVLGQGAKVTKNKWGISVEENSTLTMENGEISGNTPKDIALAVLGDD